GSGVRWLAQVFGATRVFVDDGATTVGALAKTLPHQPLAAAELPVDLDTIAGVAAPDLVIWAAYCPVILPARQQAPLNLHMVSLRVLRRQDGSLIKTLYGLAKPQDGAVVS